MDIVKEYAGVELVDERLSKRVFAVAQALSEGPERSFPKVFKEEASLEGFYRLVNHQEATLGRLIEVHT